MWGRGGSRPIRPCLSHRGLWLVGLGSFHPHPWFMLKWTRSTKSCIVMWNVFMVSGKLKDVGHVTPPCFQPWGHRKRFRTYFILLKKIVRFGGWKVMKFCKFEWWSFFMWKLLFLWGFIGLCSLKKLPICYLFGDSILLILI